MRTIAGLLGLLLFGLVLAVGWNMGTTLANRIHV